MIEWELTDSERDEILRRVVLPLVFPDAPPTEEPPILILLAGQPGSRHSSAAGSLVRQHPDNLATVSADELRAFHPNFPDLVTAGAPEALEGVARATAGWLRDCIRFARENSRSVLVDGAFQDPALAVGMAERFGAAGFQTRLVIVASRRAESLLSAASLYLSNVRAGKLARFVSRDAHDRALEATRALAAKAAHSASVDRLTVIGRAGDLEFDAVRADGDEVFRDAGAALEAGQSAHLSRFDSTQWLSELHHLTDFAMTRRDLPRGAIELLVELHEIALREVIPELHVPTDGKFISAIEHKTIVRLDELRRALPREEVIDLAAPVVTPRGPERGGISR